MNIVYGPADIIMGRCPIRSKCPLRTFPDTIQTECIDQRNLYHGRYLLGYKNKTNPSPGK